MQFKAGDRVHVTRLDWEDVNFFATLEKTITDGVFRLIDCSLKDYTGRAVKAPHRGGFGNEDSYTLATDEEDTEEPVIQRINDMYNDVPTHYKADIDVIEFCRQHFTDEEFKGAMKFNLIKYPTRLGRKDDMVKELDKIIDYAQRYKEVLENELTQ